MIDYKQLQALVAIIEEASFERAAIRLNVTQSAVSQRLKQLEERLGQTLIIRATPLTATPAGQQLLKHYQQVSLLERELIDTLALETQQGYSTIAIGLNADSLATWFLEAVEPLLLEDKILLELKLDDQDQTHHLLRTGQVAGCISANHQPMQGCNCIPLGTMIYRCLANKDYIARHFPEGPTAEAFRTAPVAEFSNKDELQNRYLDKFFGVGPSDYPKHRIPSTESFFQMIINGMACGMIPDQQSQPLLDSGQVIDITPGYFLEVPLYWHVWNLKSELYRKLTTALRDTAERHLSPLNSV